MSPCQMCQIVTVQAGRSKNHMIVRVTVGYCIVLFWSCFFYMKELSEAYQLLKCPTCELCPFGEIKNFVTHVKLGSHTNSSFCQSVFWVPSMYWDWRFLPRTYKYVLNSWAVKVYPDMLLSCISWFPRCIFFFAIELLMSTCQCLNMLLYFVV
jgi:hypothetical protein